MPVLATRKPRIGYKVIRPTLPPTTGTTTFISAPIAVSGMGGHHVYQSPPHYLPDNTGSPVPPAQPVQAGQQWHHPHSGVPSSQHYAQYTAVPPGVVSHTCVLSIHIRIHALLPKNKE